MTEFKSDPLAFRRQTARRWLLEMLLLIVLLATLLLELVPMIPRWVQWALVTSFGAYILVGLVLYPRARAIASSFRVSLDGEGLSFSHAYGGGKVRYSDLKVEKVKRRHGELVEIVLVAESGQVVRLRTLENMTELHRSLSERIAS